MSYDIIPVEAVNIDNNLLDLHRITNAESLNRAIQQKTVDGFLQKTTGSYLFVSCPIRFKNLAEGLGKNPKRVSLNESVIPIELTIERNSPRQYLGASIRTENSIYHINDEMKIFGRRDIDGCPVESAGAIPRELYMLASIMLNSRTSWLEFMSNHALNYAMPGMRLVVALTEESQKETGRNGLVTSPIWGLNDIPVVKVRK
jgi:hypothetical protein